MVKIYGNGLMWIPTWGKAVQFNDGIFETNDPIVIDCAKINWFEIEGDISQYVEEKESAEDEKEPVKKGRKPGVK